jgi:hypothetical protein
MMHPSSVVLRFAGGAMSFGRWERLSCWIAAGLLLPLAARAADGLAAPAPDTLWLGLEPRVTLQTQPLTAWWQARLGEGGAPSGLRGIQSASVLGDYYFAQPSFGRFRASGGLWISPPAGSEGWAPAPYLGLGYSTPARWGAFSFSADLGVAAESTLGSQAGLGRALLGVQGLEHSRRELRLSPVLQFGMRYSF